ncbi:MAG: hypothetical protein V3U65_12565 [Granulosicoccaceae bacterium]
MFYRIFALLLLVPFNAQAIECESESPLKLILGDAYYDLDSNLEVGPVPAKHPLQQTIMELESAQFRSGQATTVICKSIDGEVVPVTRTYKLKDGSSHYTKHGDIDLSVWLDDIENRDSKKQLITLPLSIAWASGNTENEWFVNRRFRRLNGGTFSSTSSFVELDIALTVTDNGIGVRQTIYANGYFAEQSNWTLLKR